MADNIQLSTNVGSGAVLRTDEVDTDKHVQYVKLMDGTANSDTVIAGGSDGLEVDPSDREGRDLGKVDIASLDQYTPNTGRLPVYIDAVVDVTPAVPAADDYLPVRITNGAAFLAPGGVSADDDDFTAGTTDGIPAMGVYESSPSSVTDGDLGIVGITATRALKTSTAVTSVPAPLSTTGGGTEATALRVTVATDSTGVLSIDDNGGAITVDGTVTANLSATDNTVLDNIQTAVELIDNAISGAGFNVTQLGGAAVPIGAGTEAAAIRVTLPTNGTGVVGLAAGTAAVGKLVANSGVDIGDVDVTSVVPGSAATNLGKAEDAGHSSGDVGVMALAVRDDALAPNSGADQDYEPLHTTNLGALWVTPAPAASGAGLSIGRVLDVDETEDEIVAAPCTLYGYFFFDADTATNYLKFYNATAANVTVGTTTPALTFPLPAGAAGHVEFSHGIAFSTAMSIAVTASKADNATDDPGADMVCVNVFYK